MQAAGKRLNTVENYVGKLSHVRVFRAPLAMRSN